MGTVPSGSPCWQPLTRDGWEAEDTQGVSPEEVLKPSSWLFVIDLCYSHGRLGLRASQEGRLELWGTPVRRTRASHLSFLGSRSKGPPFGAFSP